MVRQATLQIDRVLTFEDAQALDNSDVQNQVVASTLQEQVESADDNAQVAVPKCICINWEDLKCFEPVEGQYERWGVIFHNALAIQPSNPAFPPHSGLTVLMGSPKGGFLEASFLYPVNCVSACVTSSQRLVMSAYDRDRQLLAQTVLPAANFANSDSALSPNTLLTVTANNIHSVTFCAFDGQFTLDDFRFCS